MLKKLTEEQQDMILDVATKEFGEKGLKATNINHIARDSSVSVGVIYKYYGNKEALFLACLDRSLSHLGQTLQTAVCEARDFKTMLSYLISVAVDFSQMHRNEIRMYQWITTASGKEAKKFAREIEAASSKLYKELFSKAKSDGFMSLEMDPDAFAFFFDSLLMMLQFTYGCDYYDERRKLYFSEKDEDSFVANQMVRFLNNSLGVK